MELNIATDKECVARRNALIYNRIIKPGKYIGERNRLIEKGLINPNLCEVEQNKYIVNSEEGEYKSRPIGSNEEYEKRKLIYFRILQEVLQSRRDLKLILAIKEKTDPEWYF